MANTTNYGWTKPVVGGDTDAWGGELNTDLDGIDSTVFAVSGVANAALPKAGGTMTGAVTLAGVSTAPTAAPGTNTTQIATTAFVATSFAPIASPTFTGTPAAPTASGTTNTTQIATTAFSRSMLAARPITTATPTDPAGTTVADPGVMCGYGSVMTITPQISGRVLAIFSGAIRNNTLNATGAAAIRYGTGTAPAGAAAATGTIAPPAMVMYANNLPANANVPITLVRVVTGLTVGTAYWFDLSYSSSSGTTNIFNSQATVVEL